MLDTPDAVLTALRENDARPYGRQRTVTAEELVDAAEPFDDPGLLASALLELMEAYEYDGERTKLPVVFARVLKLWDADRTVFSEWGARQVLWRFKWVAAALLATPDVPLEAIDRWHRELRDRYTAADAGLQPYHAERHHLAAHTGRDREQAFDLWATRPRAELSDCPACETRARALHHVRAGDDERALAVWQPVFDGPSSCREEPYVSHAHALLPLLRLGRTDEARSGHLVGYRYARGKTGTAREIGLHLEFCALSGNQPRGLEILAENRDLFTAQGDPLARLDFLTGTEVLLAALVRDGHGEVAVSGPPGTTWTAGALLAHVRAEAEPLAARFDARNGTDAVGAARRERLARRPLLAEPLALGVRAAGPLTPGPGTAPVAEVPAGPRPGAEPLPDDLTALVLRAREIGRLGHPDARAMWDRITEAVEAEDYRHADSAELGTLARLTAEIAEHRVAEAADRRGTVHQDRAELDAVADLFEQAGLPGEALATRARAAVVELGEDSGTPDWAELDDLLRRAEELLAVRGETTGDADGEITDDDYLGVLHCRAFAAHHDLVLALPETPAEQVERFEAAVGALRAESTARGVPHRVLTVRQFLADVAARRDRLDEAVTELRGVLAELETLELPWRSPRTLGLLGQLLLQREEPAEAAEVLHRALGEAARWREPVFPYARTYALLGEAAARSGDVGAAVRALSEAAARFDRAAEPVFAAHARLLLADVLRGSGQGVDAVAVLESVLLDPAVGELDERMVAQLRLTLARGLYELDENLAAAEEYLRLADAVAGWEDRDTHTMVACEATVALVEAGRLDAARAARERALASHAEAPRPDQMAGTLRHSARHTMVERGAEGLEDALALLAEAEAVRERAEAAGDAYNEWCQRGALEEERARAYATADRPEEALAAAERAIAAYEAGGEEAEPSRAETVRLAAFVEGRALGRTDAAVARLGAGMERCERLGLTEAAAVLGELRRRLAEQG
ncbi:hypothetical protein [Kitasatospora camelliae]|uniref:Tetratricopeptide repeat protein n=1 Tax=Kitasatospora camelliae TaxID=3156397 RepID=A0AAU8JP75_9ACTN